MLFMLFSCVDRRWSLDFSYCKVQNKMLSVMLHSNIRIYFTVFCFLTSVRAWDVDSDDLQNRADPLIHTVFLYFAYGSDMFEEIMKMKCPEAILYAAAVLPKHRLDFTVEAPWRNGAVATICKDPDHLVWGIVWIIKVMSMEKLDEQGVYAGWRHAEEVTVFLEGNRQMKAITYVQNHNPKKLHPLDNYPPERQPSLSYLRMMIKGAVRGKIPDDYVQYLYSIHHNGREEFKQLVDKVPMTTRTRASRVAY